MRRISEPIRIFTLHLFCKQNSLFLVYVLFFFVSFLNFFLPIFCKKIHGFDNAYTQPGVHKEMSSILADQ
jgi:hypothetical protein